MTTKQEYMALAAQMGEIIADAAMKRGEIARQSQADARQAKRDEAAAAWASGDADAIAALDLGGEPSTDGPIPTVEGQGQLERLIRDTRYKVRRVILDQIREAEKLSASAPQDLTNLVLVLQGRNSAEPREVADLYAMCAGTSWPLAKSVADAGRRHGVLVWDEAGALAAEVPSCLMRKADELLAQIEGKTAKRPTNPAHGAQSVEHGSGKLAVLELKEAVDAAVVDIDRIRSEVFDDKNVLSVYDCTTGNVTAVRASKGANADLRAMKRLARDHAHATGEAVTDFAAQDAAILRAFRM